MVALVTIALCVAVGIGAYARGLHAGYDQACADYSIAKVQSHDTTTE